MNVTLELVHHTGEIKSDLMLLPGPAQIITGSDLEDVSFAPLQIEWKEKEMGKI